MLFCFQLVLITFNYSQVFFHPLWTAALKHVVWQDVIESEGCALRAGLKQGRHRRHMTHTLNCSSQQKNKKHGVFLYCLFNITVHLHICTLHTLYCSSVDAHIKDRRQFKPSMWTWHHMTKKPFHTCSSLAPRLPPALVEDKRSQSVYIFYFSELYLKVNTINDQQWTWADLIVSSTRL